MSTVSDTVAGLLERALEALERYEDEEALQRLLEAWREVRAERLAVLAERLTGLVACNPDQQPTGPFGTPSNLELHLTRGVANPFIQDFIRNRLGVLLREPADPRLTGALLAFAAIPRAGQEDLFRPLCELFLHMKDPRAAGPLRALSERLPAGSPYARQLDLTLEGMEEALPLSEAAAARCEVLESALARREQAVERGAPLRDELLAHVGAHPEDDDARLVLADHLLEHGDPLGEFIALQCRPEPDEARSERLLNLHHGRWKALLGPGFASLWCAFQRGLPETVMLRVTPGPPLPPPGAFWCAVRKLDWTESGDEAHADWLAHPHLRNVTTLWRVPLRLAARLGAHPLPVRELVMAGGVTHGARGVFNALASLPHLTRLEVRGATLEDVRLCVSSPLARRLEHVALDGRSWRLIAVPGAKVPVEATLRSEEHFEVFTEVLRAAVGFGTRALRIYSQDLHPPDLVSRLERAASAYERIEWDLALG